MLKHNNPVFEFGGKQFVPCSGQMTVKTYLFISKKYLHVTVFSSLSSVEEESDEEEVTEEVNQESEVLKELDEICS